MRLYSCNYEENSISFKVFYIFTHKYTCRVGGTLFEILVFELKMLDD